MLKRIFSTYKQTILSNIQKQEALFEYMGDISPIDIYGKSTPLTFNCEKLIILNSSHKFIYHWFTPSLFPNVKKVYLDKYLEDRVLEKWLRKPFIFVPYTNNWSGSIYTPIDEMSLKRVYLRAKFQK